MIKKHLLFDDVQQENEMKNLNKQELRYFEKLRLKWIKETDCPCDIWTFRHEINSKAVEKIAHSKNIYTNILNKLNRM